MHIAIALLLAITAGHAVGGGSAPVPLSTLTEKAEAIVIARVLDGIVSRDRFTANLDVIRVLKGPIEPRSVITISELSAPSGPEDTGPVGKDAGMFFLRAGSKGGWALLPPTSGFLLEFRRTFILLPDDKPVINVPASGDVSVLDKVIAEAMASVNVPPGPLRTPIDLASEYRRNPSPAMKTLFAQLRSHPNVTFRAAGLRAALIDGDETALGIVQRDLNAFPEHHAAAIVEELRDRFTSSRPQAVAQLAQFVTNSATPRPLRIAGAAALARIHTIDALPHLAGLLEDPDSQVRAIAVGGIAQFANNVSPGGHHPKAGEWKYRTEDTMRNSAMDERILRENPAILAFWKAWWLQHRAELARP
jgi:hypothetical protein